MEFVVVAVAIFAMIITVIPIISSSHGTEHSHCDYLIVLGAGVYGTEPSLSLRTRLDAALHYLQANPQTVAVVSGGQGNGEDISEAECMYQYLTAAGIPEDRIWKEEDSTSTSENIRFSMDVIALHTGKLPLHAAIVSSDYHLYRASMLAQYFGLHADLVPAVSPRLTLRLNYYLREIFAVWYYRLFGGY